MRKYFSEILGTFTLVFCGTGAIIINSEYRDIITNTGIAIAFGLTITIMIFLLGDISGAHFNPAVTIGFWLSKLFPSKEVLPYIISQSIGAITASITLHFIFPGNRNLGATIPHGSDQQAFIIELILSFFLMIVIMLVSKRSKEKGIPAAIIIGSVIFIEALFAGPVTGASMNPARSLAPVLVCGNTAHLWIYITAPISGVIMASCFRLILTNYRKT